MSEKFVFTTKTTQPRPQVFFLTVRFCGYYAVELTSFFTFITQTSSKFVQQYSWLWWIIPGIFARRKRRNILSEWQSALSWHWISNFISTASCIALGLRNWRRIEGSVQCLSLSSRLTSNPHNYWYTFLTGTFQFFRKLSLYHLPAAKWLCSPCFSPQLFVVAFHRWVSISCCKNKWS